MPGFGVVLAATFLANTGGNLTRVRHRRPAGQRRRPRPSTTRLRPDQRQPPPAPPVQPAAAADLLPGRPVQPEGQPRLEAFYDRKRAEGKSHKQALIALARRRINTIWAMLRDRTTYQEPAPTLPAGLDKSIEIPNGPV